MTSIFKEAGSNLPPMLCSIIVSIIQVSGAYASTVFVEAAGRKTLLLLSTIGICVGDVSMGSYYYLTSKGYETSFFNWVPLVAFSLIIFTAACGVLTVSFAFIAEITPPKIRSVMVRVQMITMFTLATIIVKVRVLSHYLYVQFSLYRFYLQLFPLLAEAIAISGVVFIFAGVSFVITIFIIIFVPETKGKSIEAIQDSL